MKILSPKIHGFLDLLTVVIFALAPTAVGLTGIAAAICYVLAAVHLLLTTSTQFPLGVVKNIPFPIHGIIELVVSIALIILPFALGWTGAERNFFIVIGIVIFLVWLLSDYKKN